MNLWEEKIMDKEEYVRAQQVIAESNTSLVVKALEESIEELRGEIEFLKEENKRLRNVSRATRTTNRNVRRDVANLISQVEEMGQHIMDIAAEEAAQESDTTPTPETTT
jgi:septation ring formation regulator EzrA